MFRQTICKLSDKKELKPVDCIFICMNNSVNIISFKHLSISNMASCVCVDELAQITLYKSFQLIKKNNYTRQIQGSFQNVFFYLFSFYDLWLYVYPNLNEFNMKT